jgi:hypothetical protein
MNFESNVLLYGLIEYTINDKIKWDFGYINKKLYYKGIYNISGKKFLIDIKNNFSINIDMVIRNNSNISLRHCFYIDIKTINTTNYNKLILEIEKKIKP